MTAPTSPAGKRIIMIAHSHILGGIERHVDVLSNALAAAGHRIAFAGPRDSWLGEAMARNGHDCLHLPMHGMYDPLSAWKLRRFARQWRADILHGHAQRGTRYALWASNGKIPVIATAHSTTGWKWFRPGLPIVAVSEAVRTALLGRGFAPEAVETVHLGVPDLGPVPAPLPGPIRAERPLRLGILGRMEGVKGHDIALDALAALGPEVPARLAFIGADTTDWARQMKERAAQLDLAGRTEFWGQRSDIAQVLGQMDVMLAPSRREALSLSLIETAAAGRPAIGAATGGIPEVIADGVSGLLVPPEDPAALAAAIARMAHADSEREAMGQAARRRYETQFALGVMVRHMESCYARIIDGGWAPPSRTAGR